MNFNNFFFFPLQCYRSCTQTFPRVHSGNREQPESPPSPRFTHRSSFPESCFAQDQLCFLFMGTSLIWEILRKHLMDSCNQKLLIMEAWHHGDLQLTKFYYCVTLKHKNSPAYQSRGQNMTQKDPAE